MRAHRAFGCSAAAPATAYLAALDPRISVTATACYITSFKELMVTQGPQDAEQRSRISGGGSRLRRLGGVVRAAGRMRSSRLRKICSPFGVLADLRGGEAIYSLQGGGQDCVHYGPGGHGNLGPISKQILGFLVTNLKGPGHNVEVRQFRPAIPMRFSDRDGAGADVARRCECREPEPEGGRGAVVPSASGGGPGDLAAVQAQIRSEVRATAKISAEAAAPAASVVEPKGTRRMRTARSVRVGERAGRGVDG